MKKRLLAASIVLLLLLAPPAAAPRTHQTRLRHLLDPDDIPVAQMEMLSHVNIADTPVIDSGDIIALRPGHPQNRLTADAYERYKALQIPTSGRSFVVCVDKGRSTGGRSGRRFPPVLRRGDDTDTIILNNRKHHQDRTRPSRRELLPGRGPTGGPGRDGGAGRGR